MMRHSATPNQPVVVANGLVYLPMAYYGSQHKIPLVYITDPESVIAFAKSDSVDLSLLAAASYFPLSVERLSTFLQRHVTFLLCCAGDPRWNWLPDRLASEHVAIRPVAVEGERTLYLVERTNLPGSGPPDGIR